MEALAKAIQELGDKILTAEQKNHAATIGLVPVRGGLFASESKLDKAIHCMQEKHLADTKVFIPQDEISESLAWNFNGEIKFLNDCTKEEILHVCQVLVKKVAAITPSDCFTQYV